MNDQPPTDQEIATAEAILAKLTPGFLPLPLFLQWARLMVVSTIELVPLRLLPEGKVQVWLVQRPPDDPNWPGMWHVPGTVLRANDTSGSFEGAFNRILKDELPGAALAAEPQFLELKFHQVRRGTECAHIFFTSFVREPLEGAFYDVEHLPPDTVEHQLSFIRHAAQIFRSLKSPTKDSP